jgi:membrane fusion protein (multidrug efflux system)
MVNTRFPIPAAIALGTSLVVLSGGFLLWHAESKVNKIALSGSPKPVTLITAHAATFRPRRSYVGTLQPWVTADVGPQLISAYVDTVLVRPGAHVRRGEILATLDCRNASASSQSVAMQARALDARQQALAHESARTQGMLSGGFVSPNEAERIAAQTVSEQANLESTRAKLVSSTLEVNDCILRAPFDGEVAARFCDPGTFVRPGTALITLIDRRIVRMTADAPESDYDVVAEGTPVKIHAFSTHKDFLGKVTRRTPAADAGTRTIHFEIDLADPSREVPVGTTGEVFFEVGAEKPATALPLHAAAVRGSKALVYVVAQHIATSLTLDVVGEAGGTLYVDSKLADGAQVVSEGRELLETGDTVATSSTLDGKE